MIVILAMVAAFLALRLYSVLGRRTEQEEQPAAFNPEERTATPLLQPTLPQPVAADRRLGDSLIAPAAENGIRQMIAQDRNFDVSQFVDGARAAYGMILEAFWAGKRDDLRWLCDTEVSGSFEQAIDQREAAGQTLENRLVRIDKAQIVDAEMSGRIAALTVQFDADIAAVTRDRDGHVIAGSMSDAITTHDVWTFTRDLGSTDPNWKLSETDEAA